MYPLISVIIPAHNAAKTIDIAIKSMIMQTYPNLEIFVVDDNSTDNTKEIVMNFISESDNIKYYSLPYNDQHRFNKHGKNINAGWMARNYGFEKVNGDWITFQDADDASLINRIEVQYKVAIEYNSSHACVDWQMFKEEYVGKKLDVEYIFNEKDDVIVPTDYILELVKETKGPLMNILGLAHQLISFSLKRRKNFEKLFFRSWEPYPGVAGAPLVKQEVMNKIKFRSLDARFWPSERGRGADRDFNFAVAEAFRDSISVRLPLYLWRVKTQHPDYKEYGE